MSPVCWEGAGGVLLAHWAPWLSPRVLSPPPTDRTREVNLLSFGNGCLLHNLNPLGQQGPLGTDACSDLLIPPLAE